MTDSLPDRNRPTRPQPTILVAIGVAIAVVAGVLGGLIVHWTTSADSTSAGPVGRCDAVTLADKVLPSVVTINVTNGSSASNGSGAFVREDGYILTNDHVISSGVDGGSFSVLMSSGETEPATLVGRATLLDLAVLKVDKEAKAPVIGIATAPVVVGQPVVALGSPLGLSGSVTSGIVSALGREIRVPADQGKTALINGAIQTDASINPGNSGGALVDCQGRLVGVNTAIATVPNAAGEGGGGSVGIGFAIPVELAAAVADELIATGAFSLPTFGWSVAPITPQIAAEFGLPAGMFIRSTTAEGAAALAGLQPGDVVTHVDGQPSTDEAALTRVVLDHKAGDQITVAYHRDGQDLEASLTLQ